MGILCFFCGALQRNNHGLFGSSFKDPDFHQAFGGGMEAMEAKVNSSAEVLVYPSLAMPGRGESTTIVEAWSTLAHHRKC